MASSYVRKALVTFEKYGLIWPITSDPIAIEMHMIQQGGRFRNKRGEMSGNGLFFHYKAFQTLLWPQKVWHKWSDLQLQCYLDYRTIGCIGAASTGKTFCAASDVLSDYYAFSDCTTVICCSTTRERLEDRVFGEMKKLHRMAKEVRSWIPGNLIEGKQRIVTDDRGMASEGRDFRNGIVGVACLHNNSYVGISSFVGIKNKRVRLLADELSLLPRIFVDAISNLDKNPDFKAIGLGNPKDTTDALGILCEPSAKYGGWEGGIDQTPGTKTWETRRAQGICIQLPGSDSPNLDGKLGAELITQSSIDRDVAFYGRDSLWFSMMNEGRMPRGQGSRRVLTRNMAVKHRAMEEPAWRGTKRTKIAFLDAAYKGVGGDRCVYGELEFGEEVEELDAAVIAGAIINQNQPSGKRRQIVAITSMEIVPIVAGSKQEEAEDQIVTFVKSRCDTAGINPDSFFFDAGMRTGLVSAFARLWSVHVSPIDCGGKPTERPVSSQIQTKACDYYSKFITELWFSVRLIVEATQLRGMSEEVVMEFSQREWKIVGANKIECESKSEMKLKTGRSPDLADACAVGLEGARRKGFVIDRLDRNAPKTARTADWAKELKARTAKMRQDHSLTHA